ncbi:hypothetical protein MMC14_009097 [Varicellaria rhodocarpa]|nr:hypothetical protein [Varicellaria rhodocarpa]
MALNCLPQVSNIPGRASSERIAILDLLFEPCQQLHTLSLGILRDQSFTSYNDLIATIGVQLTDLAESHSTSDTAWLEKILGAHPRLGEKRVESVQSRAEQVQLKATEASQETVLMTLNEEYEQSFPGLRYVVFVNGRDRSLIMDDMRARIKRGDIKLERLEAIKVGPSVDRKNKKLISPKGNV